MAEDKKVEKDAKKPADKKKKPGKNPFKAIVSFFKSVNAERKKVVWPNAKETLKNTAIVLVVAVIVGVAIYAVDSALSAGMELLKNVAPERTTVSDTVDGDDAEDAEDKDAEGEDKDAEDAEDEKAEGEDEAEADDTAEDATDDGEDE